MRVDVVDCARTRYDLFSHESTMSFSAKIEGNELVIRLTMHDKPERSASGKTLVVASTRGNKETECVVNGKKVIVGLNAYIEK